MKRPTHFSWSSLEKFEQCPRRWYHKYIERLREPKSEALQRGIDVHEALELALKTKGTEPTFGGGWLASIVELYRSFGAEAEQNYYVDRNWGEIPPDPIKFMPDGTYTMAKLDVLSTRDGFFADWKTGKVYADKHEQQAELYATVLTAVTGRKRWDVDLVYVDQGIREQLAFEIDDVDNAIARWDARARPLFEATVFPKKPSRLCDYCAFRMDKGGPCDGRKE